MNQEGIDFHAATLTFSSPAASAAVGVLLVLLVSMSAALAYSIAGAGNQTLTLALSDISWAFYVLSSLPRAMLIMAGTFGSGGPG